MLLIFFSSFLIVLRNYFDSQFLLNSSIIYSILEFDLKSCFHNFSKAITSIFTETFSEKIFWIRFSIWKNVLLYLTYTQLYCRWKSLVTVRTTKSCYMDLSDNSCRPIFYFILLSQYGKTFQLIIQSEWNQVHGSSSVSSSFSCLLLQLTHNYNSLTASENDTYFTTHKSHFYLSSSKIYLSLPDNKSSNWNLTIWMVIYYSFFVSRVSG